MKRVAQGYRLGFSGWGLAAFLLVMAPNLVWMAAPPANDVQAAGNVPLALDILENVFRVLTFLLPIFVVRKQPVPKRRAWLAVAAVCLLGYYALWAVYYAGAVQLVVLLGMAVLPTAVFAGVAAWLHNGPALWASGLFGVTHIAVTMMMQG